VAVSPGPMTPIKILVMSDHAKAMGFAAISSTQSILILGQLGAG
jgi:hypothetical protein